MAIAFIILCGLIRRPYYSHSSSAGALRRAQAAVAAVTGRDAREVGALSVQQLAFCCGVPPDRGCSGGWTLEDALPQRIECAPLLLDKCLPYKPDYDSTGTTDELCSGARLCNDTSPVASKGTYRYRALFTVWEVQASGHGG